MVDRYLKIVLTAIAVFFMLTIETPSASASCSSKTCTEAFQGCVSIGCHKESGGGQCFGYCNAEREKCMQTGEFLGRYCQYKGLIKK
jgi:hypothetical protein